MLTATAGHAPKAATSSREPVPDYTSRLGGDLKGMRVGVIRELNTGVSEPVARAFSAALKQLGSLGATVEEVSIPSFVEGSLVTMVVLMAEALEFHEQWIRERPGDYGSDVRSLLSPPTTLSSRTSLPTHRP